MNGPADGRLGSPDDRDREPAAGPSPLERAVGGPEPALVTYLVAGDPSLAETKRYVEAMDRAGADVIELGLPFSEPIAEGPTIRSAIDRALETGISPERFFDAAADLETDASLVVMTYYNLLLQYGREAGEAAGPSDAHAGVRAFVERAAEAGLSGCIVPDLPVEESGPLLAACEEFGLDLVFVVAPTTTGDRLERILSRASGFVYVQARLGTTGARADVSTTTHESLARVADAATDLPTAVGFGVSAPDHAAEIVRAGADGVVVGSALVDLIASADDPVGALESKTCSLVEGARRGAEPEGP